MGADLDPTRGNKGFSVITGVPCLDGVRIGELLAEIKPVQRALLPPQSGGRGDLTGGPSGNATEVGELSGVTITPNGVQPGEQLGEQVGVVATTSTIRFGFVAREGSGNGDSESVTAGMLLPFSCSELLSPILSLPTKHSSILLSLFPCDSTPGQIW